MNNKRKMKIIVGLTIPLTILISMIIIPLYTLYFGEEVLLETIPYDPRDLLRGDYVTLNYKINQVPLEKFPDELKDRDSYDKYKNKKIYAVLKKEGEMYTVDYMTFVKPKDRIFLTAKLRYFYSFNEVSKVKQIVHVSYNLDKYFVPENTGKELEEMSRKGELVARVKIYNGQAILIDVSPKH